MIFKNVNNLVSKADKSLFKELVSIYCMIVREICSKNNIKYEPNVVNINSQIITELINIGVITDAKQVQLLSNEIGSLFNTFIYSIDKYLNHKLIFGDLLVKLNNKERKELQKKIYTQKKPTVVDFFAGAGGLSYGFTQAGFKICLANDIEDVCIATYRYNHPEIPYENIIQGDIRTIVNNIKNFIHEDIDVVVGGPPCQGFSTANQQRIIDDPRNELYKYFIESVKSILPKFVIMENVRGMLTVADQVVEDFKAINITKDSKSFSYDVQYKILNSSKFSVAQTRERLFYIAIRNDIGASMNISPKDIFDTIDLLCQSNKIFNLSDAIEYIKPLNAPRIKNMNEIDSDTCGKKIDFNQYSGHDNEYLTLINNGKNIPLVFNHKARYVNDVNYEIYRLLKPGEDASNEKIADIMPYKHRLHCFKDKYYKLIPNKPSRTITAHLKMDCHSHIHPFQIRAISPREAARCQSFPDDYLFLGPYLKTYMEIGNAVPCLMAKTIATAIKKYL